MRPAKAFGNTYPGTEHRTAGPVTGLAVRDLHAAVEQHRQITLIALAAALVAAAGAVLLDRAWAARKIHAPTA